jgi:hypothetical protein
MERHANRYDGLTWCDAREDWNMNDGLDVVGSSGPIEDLDAVTCVECLRRIVRYGEQAERRLVGGDPVVNNQQQRALAWAAFQAGVSNGGDSSPRDDDYEDIQRSVQIAFESWWRQFCEDRSRRRR